MALFACPVIVTHRKNGRLVDMDVTVAVTVDLLEARKLAESLPGTYNITRNILEIICLQWASPKLNEDYPELDIRIIKWSTPVRKDR
jgi:hypothetical protein